jgi:hypothetical protein
VRLVGPSEDTPLRLKTLGSDEQKASRMPKNSIGLIELSSIAAGFEACDAMLKASDVELILSRTICSGKYMVMVRYGRGSVKC